MDYLFGLKTKDFVVLAADRSRLQSIYVLSDEASKCWRLGESIAMGCVGEGGDAEQFAEYLDKNMQLYRFRNGYELSPKAAAAFARRTLAESIRSRNPYLVHTMVAGYDKEEGPYLTYMDYMGTQFEGPYLLHGYGGYFCYSILDRMYRPDLKKEEAIEALQKCLSEVRKRFIINMPNFQVIIIDKEGFHQLENITV